MNTSQNLNKSILLLDTNDASARHIKTILECLDEVEIIHEGKEINEFLSLIRKHTPDIVIFNLSPSLEASINLSRQMTSMFPEVTLIAAADTMDTSVILKVMRARVREFLKQPVSQDELLSVIHHVFSEKEAALSLKTVESKIITFFGPKGGVGTTTVATNMATSLARHTKKDVIIVDLDLQFGNVALHMNVKSKYSILDIVNCIDQIEIPLLKSQMPKGTNGVSVLSVPSRIEDVENIKSVHIEKLLLMLRKVFDYIIIDTHNAFDDLSIKAMDESNFVLLVTTLDVPSLFHTKRSLQLFQKMAYTMEKLFIVINRYNALEEFDLKSTEKMLDFPIFWSIPEQDYQTMISSINRGNPISSMKPDLKLSQNFLEMAMKFNGLYHKKTQDEKSQKKRSLFMFKKTVK
ncbi:AAA family ATPase [bacterium]|nr:AAA family ATPase [bacterium]